MTPGSRLPRAALIFLLPLLSFVGIFILLPVAGTFVTSLFQDVAFLPTRFVGFENYRFLLSDPGFWTSARFTVLFTAVTVPLELLIGLGFALILHEKLPLRGMLRACVLIPWAVPTAISSRTWELMYNYHYGLANFLCLRLHVCHEPVSWLGSSFNAFFALVLTDAWKTAPFVAIILLAGLQAIPSNLYDQAKVDRADFLQRFRLITLPLLKPVFLVALLFRTIDTLRIFDVMYIITQGGPGGATTSLSLYGYRYYLMGDFGYGAAVSVVLFFMALALSLFYVKAGRFRESINHA